MSDVRTRYARVLARGSGTERIAFFSDAVFAIALTLLVLDIRLPVDTPPDELWPTIVNLWPSLLAYALTFAILGINWTSHHRKFLVMERFDGGLIWLNLLLLFFVALVPFPTSVLAEYAPDLAAVALYSGMVVALGGAQALTWWYAWRRSLLAASIDRVLFIYVLRNVLVGPVVFLLSIPLAFWNPLAAMYFWILIWPASLLVQRIPIRAARSAAAPSRSPD